MVLQKKLKIQWAANICNPNTELEDKTKTITREEFDMVLNSIPDNKALGIDDIHIN